MTHSSRFLQLEERINDFINLKQMCPRIEKLEKGFSNTRIHIHCPVSDGRGLTSPRPRQRMRMTMSALKAALIAEGTVTIRSGAPWLIRMKKLRSPVIAVQSVGNTSTTRSLREVHSGSSVTLQRCSAKRSTIWSLTTRWRRLRIFARCKENQQSSRPFVSLATDDASFVTRRERVSDSLPEVDTTRKTKYNARRYSCNGSARKL